MRSKRRKRPPKAKDLQHASAIGRYIDPSGLGRLSAFSHANMENTHTHTHAVVRGAIRCETVYIRRSGASCRCSSRTGTTVQQQGSVPPLCQDGLPSHTHTACSTTAMSAVITAVNIKPTSCQPRIHPAPIILSCDGDNGARGGARGIQHPIFWQPITRDRLELDDE